MLDGAGYGAAAERHKNGVDGAAVRRALAACAQRGIVFYRDGGDMYNVSVFAKKIAAEYGIDYRTPVFMIHKRGSYGSMFGPGFESVSEYRALVGRAAELGADFIKLAVSGIMDFGGDGRPTGPALNESETREMVNIAHGEGFAVMAHVNGARAILSALEAGADSIEHGYWPDGGTVTAMLQTGAVWTPTRAAVRNLTGTGMYGEAVLSGVLDAQARCLSEAYARGVPVASGSDCGALAVPQGAGTLDEYRLLGELGIDPARGNERVALLFKRG
jgi:imidazolonepropionase-like amidohydrolase